MVFFTLWNEDRILCYDKRKGMVIMIEWKKVKKILVTVTIIILALVLVKIFFFSVHKKTETQIEHIQEIQTDNFSQS